MKKKDTSNTTEFTVDVITGDVIRHSENESDLSNSPTVNTSMSTILNALVTDVKMDGTYMEPSLGAMVSREITVCGKDYINSITAETARQSIFIINRRLAVKFPLQVQAFNNSKVNALDELKFWSDYLYTGGRKPDWMFVKGVAKASGSTKKSKPYTAADMKRYADAYDISMRDLTFAEKIYPDATAKEIMDYKKYIESINKKEI